VPAGIAQMRGLARLTSGANDLTSFTDRCGRLQESESDLIAPRHYATRLPVPAPTEHYPVPALDGPSGCITLRHANLGP
jgi:hypothetical protein